MRQSLQVCQCLVLFGIKISLWIKYSTTQFCIPWFKEEIVFHLKSFYTGFGSLYFKQVLFSY